MSSLAETASERGRILIFHSDKTHGGRIAQCFLTHRLTATVCNDGTMALAVVYNEPPDVILVHQNIGPHGGSALAQVLREDNVFAHLPILLLVHPEEVKKLAFDGADLPFDDFIHEDAEDAELVTRAHLSIRRAHRQLDASPLTRLPGNNSIAKELDARIARREEFAVVYADIDHFKAFNDRYGFARGDEALKLTARLMINSVNSESPERHYVGHVGGDDYVIIVPADRVQGVCERFIANFDGIIPSLYDEEDRARGFIRSVNRQGRKEDFPIMAISLAVVANTEGQFEHAGQLVSVAAEIKKELKKTPTSGYMIDRRRYVRGESVRRADTRPDDAATPEALKSESL
ncbi:diguanylate cyclase [Candidatus Sumerlaeota bacterium]|nr:diguanylate cyclase [Candidatus Sumerlaeota bacterium]